MPGSGGDYLPRLATYELGVRAFFWLNLAGQGVDYDS